jgi:UDP-N-acetylmuramate dehydrogenase
VQNVGAYGQEVSDTIESVRALDLRNLDLHEDRIVVLPRPACGFRYRASIFNGSERGRYIILRVNYRLKRGGAPSLKYADLQKHFAGKKVSFARRSARGGARNTAQQRDADCPRRRRLPQRRIVLQKSGARRSAVQRRGRPRRIERTRDSQLSRSGFATQSIGGVAGGTFGFSKGYAAGAAGISSKHALALINRGDAKASDIVGLKDDIQRGVQEAWGILLEPEPVFVGF